MKKNIIFFLHNLNVGGAEKNFINYANYLSNNNINVKIVCLSAKGILKKNINRKVKVIDLNKKKLKYSIFSILKIINSTKADILFSSLLHISLLLCFFKKAAKSSLTGNVGFLLDINFWLSDIFFYKYYYKNTIINRL